jgi:hypothetical protein
MKYACLIYGDGNEVDPISDEELNRVIVDSVAFDKELRRKGQLILGQPLEPAHTATTIRTKDGKLSMTDGPYAETKEQLGGILIIEARDLNEAIRIASAHPAARWDTIEVRAMRDMPTLEP